MLTVDKSEFLDQHKFSTCDINSNRSILSLTISLKLSSTLLCYDQSQNSLLSTQLSFSKHGNWSEADKARLHLNLAHAQQGKSRRLAEVPSSSRRSKSLCSQGTFSGFHCGENARVSNSTGETCRMYVFGRKSNSNCER